MNRYMLIVPALAILLAACSPNPQTETTTPQSVNEQTTPVVSENSQESPTANLGTIVDVAVANGNFTTLVQAVTAAGLVETLSSEGPFTVFAPTDEAFANVPAATLESLLADPEALANVLTYHVVAGKVMSTDVVNLDSATTVQGQDLTIDTSNGVMINNAKVITADIETSNGVIHVIDAVLLPPAE
jgi:uncharacterized surface protein with fasciclin (FAS1) repeats